MTKRLVFSAIVLISAGFSSLCECQDLTLTQTSATGIYKKGEDITIKAYAPVQKGDTLHIKIFRDNNILISNRDIIIGSDSIIVYQTKASDPGSVIIETKTKNSSASIGSVIDPDKLIPGAKCPRDFKTYWEKIKKELSALPFDIKRSPVLGTDSDKGYSCEDIELNCPGPKPARGYYAKPENAKAGSLPAVLLVHAAGVKGWWCRSEPGNALLYAKMGTICFDLNAHGMFNDQPDKYYADLENGELKTYWLKGLTNRDSVYFRAMYMRLLRTIDFLTRQPEWDGKRILVMGESQGGGQALASAGLDQRVSAAVAIVPAMCDWFGSLAGRMGGWPQPYESDASKKDMLKALPYFDNANILKDCKATLFVEIGLIDMTCPATSVFAAINQVKSPKTVVTVPYRPHQLPDNADLRREWENNIYAHRKEFINNYLK